MERLGLWMGCFDEMNIIKIKMRNIIKEVLRSFKKIVPVYVPVIQSDLLKGRTALVTGGTRGIGYAIAKRFLESGATVIITGRNAKRVQNACEKIKNENKEAYRGQVFGIEMDVSDVQNLEKKFDEILSNLNGSKIDILVNNAGINSKGTFGNTLEGDFDSVLNTNLKGTYFLSQIIAKYMQKNKIEGNILNIASSSSLRPATSSYMLSKWGLRGLTLGLAKTLIPYGIIVNGLAPGPTATSLLIKDNYTGIETSSVPAGRYATAEEIANMAVVLVSSIGRMVVGDIVYITGGAGIITLDDMTYPF